MYTDCLLVLKFIERRKEYEAIKSRTGCTEDAKAQLRRTEVDKAIQSARKAEAYFRNKVCFAVTFFLWCYDNFSTVLKQYESADGPRRNAADDEEKKDVLMYSSEEDKQFVPDDGAALHVIGKSGFPPLGEEEYAISNKLVFALSGYFDRESVEDNVRVGRRQGVTLCYGDLKTLQDKKSLNDNVSRAHYW